MVGQQRIQEPIARFEREIFVKHLKNRESSMVLGICSQLCMLRQWITCFFISVQQKEIENTKKIEYSFLVRKPNVKRTTYLVLPNTMLFDLNSKYTKGKRV
jgi:hypothetical protein